MQGQMATSINKGPPSFTREKIKEIFFASEEKKFESMKSMLEKQKADNQSQ
jgi:hypothetical protein